MMSEGDVVLTFHEKMMIGQPLMDAPRLARKYAVSDCAVRFPWQGPFTGPIEPKAEIAAAKRWLVRNGWRYEIHGCTWWHPRAVRAVEAQNPQAFFRQRKA